MTLAGVVVLSVFGCSSYDHSEAARSAARPDYNPYVIFDTGVSGWANADAEGFGRGPGPWAMVSDGAVKPYEKLSYDELTYDYQYTVGNTARDRFHRRAWGRWRRESVR